MSLYQDTKEAYFLQSSPQRELYLILPMLFSAIFLTLLGTGLDRVDFFVFRAVFIIWAILFWLFAQASIFGGNCAAEFVKQNKTELIALLGPETLTHSGKWSVAKHSWTYKMSHTKLLDILPPELAANKLLTVGYFWSRLANRGAFYIILLPGVAVFALIGLNKIPY